MHFLGTRTDVEQILPAFDVFALSSLWEGQPIALLEAMACGVPCVATVTDGARELFEEIPAGILVPFCDPESLAGAFNRLRASPESVQQLGEMGRNGTAARNYEKLAEALCSVYLGVRK